MATATARATTTDRIWRPPPRSPVQERFYRTLMQTKKLPSPPEIAEKVSEALKDDDVNTRQIADLIARDPALTASLLRLSNSALFASRMQVTNILQAVNMLGLMRVRDVVLGLSVWGKLDPQDENGRRWRRELWVHTANVAAAARTFAKTIGGDADAAFAAGLLHDVGKLVLGIQLGDSYWSMLDMAREQSSSSAGVEREAFGCDHSTVGGWLLELWKLPVPLVHAVALHHEPLATGAPVDLAGLIWIADRLVHGSDPATGEVPPDVLIDIEAVAPALATPERWRALHEELARERGAIEAIFS
jgi:putative nucleotidyltransferase with HDIG domain